MFPSSHQSLKEKLIHEESLATLDEVLAHLKTAFHSNQEAVSSAVGPANPALEDVDSLSPQEKQLLTRSTSLKQSQTNNQPLLPSHVELSPPTSLFFNPWVDEISDSSALKPGRDLPRVAKCDRSSKTCQTTISSSSNAATKENASGASLVTNQVREQVSHDGSQTRLHLSPLQSEHRISTFYVTTESKSVERCQSWRTPREDANAPSMSPQISSSSMPGPSTANGSPGAREETVGGSPEVFDSQKDVKPNVDKDVKNYISNEVKPN
ncbi:uncharacterized protein MELLADRAFT_79209, partial [Melampsora larici-populina 98AG31]